ncbi:DUF4760 domain-containing protein [Candidatus Woesearchaeota archaeon]|nr:DUF4760 domain-containing protein [Candidatus Woesearchaeota archaeon]
MEKYEKLTLILGTLNLFIVLSGVIYAGIQVFLIRKTNKESHDWNKRKTTFELLTDFTSGNFPKLLDDLNKMSKLPIDESTNYNQIYRQVPTNQQFEFDRKLSQVLNYFEGIAVSIKNEIVDEDICFDYASVIYQIYYNWSKSYIEKRRKQTNSDTIYADFENTTKRWIERLNKI